MGIGTIITDDLSYQKVSVRWFLQYLKGKQKQCQWLLIYYQADVDMGLPLRLKNSQL